MVEIQSSFSWFTIRIANQAEKAMLNQQVFKLLLVIIADLYSLIPALVSSEYEKWSLEQMNEFALKLRFIQCDQQGFEMLKLDVMYYQQVFKVGEYIIIIMMLCIFGFCQFSVDLLYSYRELKALGHPDYQKIDKKLRSTLFANALDNEVSQSITDHCSILFYCYMTG